MPLFWVIRGVPRMLCSRLHGSVRDSQTQVTVWWKLYHLSPKVTKLSGDDTGDIGEYVHDPGEGDSEGKRDTIKKKIHTYAYIKIKNFHIKRDLKENFKNKPQSGRYLQYMQSKKVEILG